MLRVIFGFFVAMIISFVATGIYLGYYKSVKIAITSPEEMHLVGVEVTGAYHLINAHIEKVESLALKSDFDCYKTFGMFFDDPEELEPEKLKSFVGCVTTEKIDLNDKESQLSYRKVEIDKAYTAQFYGSPALGPLKVYPDAKDWFEKNNLSWEYTLEIYFMSGGDFETQYIFPIPSEEVNLDKLRL